MYYKSQEHFSSIFVTSALIYSVSWCACSVRARVHQTTFFYNYPVLWLEWGGERDRGGGDPERGGARVFWTEGFRAEFRAPDGGCGRDYRRTQTRAGRGAVGGVARVTVKGNKKRSQGRCEREQRQDEALAETRLLRRVPAPSGAPTPRAQAPPPGGCIILEE